MANATSEVQVSDATSQASADMKFEIVVIPVSDVDRAKEFYARLGWRLDADYDNGKDYRVIQLTPPGSGCSVIFGKNVTAAAPGSTQGLYLIVSDIEAARAELTGRGAPASDFFHFGPAGQQPGLEPQRAKYGSFFSFSDPDGNGWLVQEVS